MKIMKNLLSLPYCYDVAKKVQYFLQPIVLAGFLIASVWTLFIAPSDFQQGEGYRIIYVHVPSAILSLNLYIIMGGLSILFLVWKLKIAALLIQCLARIGVTFAFLALVTGAIWGKPMWGTWWIWDARLTSTLILFFLYLGMLVLYQALGTHQIKDKACAILALLGSINIPIIHYSVTWWNTLHQGATITKISAPSIDASMLKPLLFMLSCFALYTILMMSILLQRAIEKRESHSHWLQERRTTHAS